MSFTARYRGWCAACDSDIAPGEEVEYRPTGRVGEADDLVHVKCPVPIVPELRYPLCQRCWCHHPGEC